MTTAYLSRDALARYLDRSRITGAVATPREANLRNIQGFLDGDQHQHMGVKRRKDWTWDSVFELMRDRVGINDDPSYTQGQDSISAQLCVSALDAYAEVFSQAVQGRKRLLFATGHPAGLAPVYARLARVARAAGARVIRFDEALPFEDGDVRQVEDVVMAEQYGGLRHTHFPEPMKLVLEHLREQGREMPDLVVADHGMAGYAGSRAGLTTIAIGDCNDPGVFVAQAQDQIGVVVPMDDNVAPHLYDPLVDYVISRAGLAGQDRA
ncbi:putative phosphatase [Kocuria varians]|uniref:Putative phosphatase n=1 Tax=Kocuria varians TaxID=1272 RepID=A0A4Y4D052_KOCVA|nr:phosphatase [Kocuria varians]GEC97956.1 putative phosphatase [Kocuria varians]